MSDIVAQADARLSYSLLKQVILRPKPSALALTSLSPYMRPIASLYLRSLLLSTAEMTIVERDMLADHGAIPDQIGFPLQTASLPRRGDDPPNEFGHYVTENPVRSKVLAIYSKSSRMEGSSSDERKSAADTQKEYLVPKLASAQTPILISRLLLMPKFLRGLLHRGENENDVLFCW